VADKPEVILKPQMVRPQCPECKEALILVALPGLPTFLGWMCDCMYRSMQDIMVPTGLIPNLREARESDDAVITYSQARLPSADNQMVM
jgi:hypothetical protein